LRFRCMGDPIPMLYIAAFRRLLEDFSGTQSAKVHLDAACRSSSYLRVSPAANHDGGVA